MTTDDDKLPHAGLLNWASAATIAMALFAYFTLKLAFHEANDSRQESRERRAHEDKMLDATQRAFLAFDRMSNYVNIQKSGDGWDLVRTADGAADKQHPMFSTIRNFGPGVALNCSMDYEILEINGKLLKEPEITNTKCSPMNILPNGESRVYAIPKCIVTDKDGKIQHAKGYVRFTFTRGDHSKQTSTQEMLIKPEYGERQPRLFLNFDGPKFLDNAGGW